MRLVHVLLTEAEVDYSVCVVSKVLMRLGQILVVLVCHNVQWI